MKQIIVYGLFFSMFWLLIQIMVPHSSYKALIPPVLAISFFWAASVGIIIHHFGESGETMNITVLSVFLVFIFLPVLALMLLEVDIIIAITIPSGASAIIYLHGWRNYVRTSEMERMNAMIEEIGK